MKIEDLIWDEAIYPRAPVSQKTVDAYVETLSIGAQFPPVRVQRVVNYSPCGDVSATVMILIDGVHRWHAFRQAGRTDIPVVHFPEAVQLLLVDMRFNLGPGRFRQFKKMIAAVQDQDFWQGCWRNEGFSMVWPGGPTGRDSRKHDEQCLIGKLGFVEVRQKGSHKQFRHPD
ncbi:hypothetical protein [Desulfobacter latus]|uniref:hypothetical protein n=1 Tax=Desulfobacter latus TaxID=2292 RepID=UPI001FE93CCE|nr:hypothetical protein [Desulfobacter latus]